MKKFLMTSVAAAAAIGMAPSAMADHHMEAQVELSAEQQATYDGWAEANRAAYDSWPADVQGYYWTLDPMQAKAWWQLNDEQRVAIFGMAPNQRAATWQSIAQQMNERKATAKTTTSASATSNARTTSVSYQSGAVVQTVPTNKVTGEYPLCNNGRTDACMNPWEAGRRGAGVTKPLDYWPGQPASDNKN